MANCIETEKLLSVKETARYVRVDLVRLYFSKLEGIGYDCVVTDFKVVNMVGTCDLLRRLYHEKISLTFNVPYTPELFPGLRVRLTDYSAWLFHTGKCTFLGSKRNDNINAAFVELLILIDQICFELYQNGIPKR